MKNYKIDQVTELGEKFFIYNEKDNNKKIYLNSNFSSEKEADKFVKQVNPDQLNIIIGIGNGAIIKKLTTIDFVQCLIIEPFEDVELDDNIIDIIEKQKNISFYYYKDISSLIINEYIKKYLGLKTNILIHPRYEKTNVEILKETVNVVKNGTIMLQVNRNTEMFFKKDWIIEPLLNLRYTLSLPSITKFHNKFEGEAAFLVASGPSLKENLHLLKKMKDKAYIFAVGSALNGLLSDEIIPDFVTVIDSSIKNYSAHFKGVNYSGPLIVSGMVNSNIIEKHDGYSILANLNIDSITTNFRKDVPAFPSVPSVSVFTLQILYYLGFSTVYLVGQDLALLNGEYYAKDIKVHMKSNTFEPQLYVESNNGSRVGTLYSLYAHLQSFNDLITLFDKQKLRIYNLSENGAKIKDVDYLPANSVELIKEKKYINVNSILEKSTYENNNFVINDFILQIKAVQKKTDEILSKLNKINHTAVSLNDLKKVLKLFKELRNQDIIENIFIKQLSFYVQKLNNKFEYTFEKEIITNQDRIEMVKDIVNLVEEIQKYFKEILDDERILDLIYE